MNKKEILYNEIYERTKDFGRTHFIKEIMRLQREYQQLKEIEKEHQRINGDLRVEIKELKDRIDKAIEYIEKDTRWFDSEYASIYGTLCTCAGAKDNRLEVMVNPSNLLEILKGDKE